MFSSSTSTSTSTSGDEGSESSHPPLTQANLCQSFMAVGSLLFSSCPDLFSSAMTQMSNQLCLAIVKNPSILRSHTSATQTSQQEVECSKSVGKETLKSTKRTAHHASFRKYVLPKDAPPDYYQCMECGEKRRENSFQNDHVHFGKKRQVRWYCPICNSYFAVTHRSGHIRNKHSPSESLSPLSSPLFSCAGIEHDGCKRTHCEEETSSPQPSEQESTLCTCSIPKYDHEEEEFDPPAQKRICLTASEPFLIENPINDITTTITTDVIKEEPEDFSVPTDPSTSSSLPDPPESSCCSSELFSDDFSPSYGFITLPYV